MWNQLFARRLRSKSMPGFIAQVGESARDVMARRLRRTAQHPGVAAQSVDPFGDTFARSLFACLHPFGQHLQMAALVQVSCAFPRQHPAELVELQRVVAIRKIARRADDERRVAEDQVESVPLDRLEQVALQNLDVINVVQHCIESRVVDGFCTDVGRDHTLAVPGCQQRVHAAAATQVEHCGNTIAHRQPAQEIRRAVLRRHHELSAVLGAQHAERVGREQKFADRDDHDVGSEAFSLIGEQSGTQGEIDE
jgi:hypothetical protein